MSTNLAVEEAKRLVASKDFKNLSLQNQYATFVQQSAPVAESASDDNERLKLFKTVMEGYLKTSEWNITGSQYTLANLEKGTTPQTAPSDSNDIDNILAATFQVSGTSRLYIAASGLSNAS